MGWGYGGSKHNRPRGRLVLVKIKLLFWYQCDAVTCPIWGTRVVLQVATTTHFIILTHHYYKLSKYIILLFIHLFFACLVRWLACWVIFFFHVKAIRTLVLYIIKILILKKMAFLIILKAKNTCRPFPKIKNFKKIIEIELLQLIVVF